MGAEVTRDVFTTLWQEIFTSLTVGNVEKLPCLRHDHQKTQWEAIGHVLVYGFELTGYIPVCYPLFSSSVVFIVKTQ